MSDHKEKFVHKPGRGTLWKGEADRPEAWTGTATLPNGDQVWVNLYPARDRDTDELRKDRDGNPYYQCTIKAKQAQDPQPAPQNDERQHFDDSEIPF